MSVAPARRVALKALAKVRRDGAFSGAVLASVLGQGRLGPEDAALTTRMVYGVLASEGILDEALARHAKGNLEPLVRDVLRLAAFEMLFGRAPSYAVVDQAVDAVRRVRPQAGGLANAVLRRLAEEAADFPWGDASMELSALSRLHAHPVWVVELVLERFGQLRGREMLSCGIDPAPTYVRLNPFGATVETEEQLAAAEAEVSPPDPDCRLLGRPSAAFSAGGTHDGWFAMDAAAQVAPLAVCPMPGERVLDLGAGRGNKTICLQSIAARHGANAEITALDVHEAKSERLRRRLHESGVGGVTVVTADALDLARTFSGTSFDAVLLDAPCTGLGTLRRYPEKRWRLVPADVARMAQVQLALLTAAASVVRPGGRVVYSTCSVARQENDDVIDAFLAGAQGKSYVIEPVGTAVPEEWDRFVDVRGCFQSWPAPGGPDGHYVAVLRRE